MTQPFKHTPPPEIMSPFTAEFIAETARQFKLEPAALETALAEVMVEYNIAAPYSRRVKDWRAASDRLGETHRHLAKALKSWWKGTEATRKTFTEFSYGQYPAAQFDIELLKLVDRLEEILEFAKLSRGSPGLAHDQSGTDLNVYRGVVAVLDQLWVEHKGRHLGHGFLADLPGDYDKNEEGALGDAGLLFAHACLRKLDPAMTRRSTSSIIRRLKRS